MKRAKSKNLYLSFQHKRYIVTTKMAPKITTTGAAQTTHLMTHNATKNSTYDHKNGHVRGAEHRTRFCGTKTDASRDAGHNIRFCEH